MIISARSLTASARTSGAGGEFLLRGGDMRDFSQRFSRQLVRYFPTHVGFESGPPRESDAEFWLLRKLAPLSGTFFGVPCILRAVATLLYPPTHSQLTFVLLYGFSLDAGYPDYAHSSRENRADLSFSLSE